MSPAWHVTLSCTLSFGFPLVLALRELYLLRRGPGGEDGIEVDPAPVLPITYVPPPLDDGPVAENDAALPAVLMPLSRPTRLPARERERERMREREREKV